MSKRVEIKNLDITFFDCLTPEQVDEAIERGFAGVDSTAETVYLIKISVGNMKVAAVSNLVKVLSQDLRHHGVTNFIFIPLCDNGIQDIEVIEVRNEAV